MITLTSSYSTDSHPEFPSTQFVATEPMRGAISLTQLPRMWNIIIVVKTFQFHRWTGFTKWRYNGTKSYRFGSFSTALGSHRCFFPTAQTHAKRI